MSNFPFNKFHLDINYSELNKQFTILRIQKRDQFLSYKNVAFLDKLLVGEECKALSICFPGGYEAYILYDKMAFKESLKGEVQRVIEDDDVLINVALIRKIPEHKIFQLFLNACSNSESNRFRYNNLNGNLLITNPHKTFFNKKDLSRVLLKVVVKRENIIKLETKTFTSLRRFNDLAQDEFGNRCSKRIGKIARKDRYFFDAANGTFQRYFGKDRDTTKELYIEMRPIRISLIRGKKKNSIDFLNLNPKNYYRTKIAMFNELILETFKSRFGSYIQVRQEQLSSEDVTTKALKSSRNPFELLQTNHLYLIDNVGCSKTLEKLLIIIKENWGLVPVIVSEPREDGINLQFNYDAAYYNGVDDPYKLSQMNCAIQNFTYSELVGDIEDASALAKRMKNVLFKVISEGQLKYDIAHGKLSIFNWSTLGLDRDWYFVKRQGDGQEEEYVFHFLSINPKGELVFTSKTRNLFDDEYHSRLAHAYSEGKAISKRSDVQGVIWDGENNINIIKTTHLESYPDLDELHNDLMRKSNIEGVSLSKERLLGFTRQFILDHGEGSRVDLLIPFLEISIEADISLIDFQKVMKKHKSDRLERKYIIDFSKEFGYWLKHQWKNKAQAQSTFASMIDLHMVTKDRDILFWGNKSMGKTQGKFQKNNTVRMIRPWLGSSILFDKILETMAVDFVRIDAPTVIPFPFKLLNEYSKMIKTPLET